MEWEEEGEAQRTEVTGVEVKDDEEEEKDDEDEAGRGVSRMRAADGEMDLDVAYSDADLGPACLTIC